MTSSRETVKPGINLLVSPEEDDPDRGVAKIKLLKAAFEDPDADIPWQQQQALRRFRLRLCADRAQGAGLAVERRRAVRRELCLQGNPPALALHGDHARGGAADGRAIGWSSSPHGPESGTGTGSTMRQRGASGLASSQSQADASSFASKCLSSTATKQAARSVRWVPSAARRRAAQRPTCSQRHGALPCSSVSSDRLAPSRRRHGRQMRTSTSIFGHAAHRRASSNPKRFSDIGGRDMADDLEGATGRRGRCRCGGWPARVELKHSFTGLPGLHWICPIRIAHWNT